MELRSKNNSIRTIVNLILQKATCVLIIITGGLIFFGVYYLITGTKNRFLLGLTAVMAVVGNIAVSLRFIIKCQKKSKEKLNTMGLKNATELVVFMAISEMVLLIVMVASIFR